MYNIDYVDDKIRMIDSKLAEILCLIESNSIYAAVSPLIKASGKKIRPLLTLLSCEAVGEKVTNGLNVAVAFELLHVASLIHDDIIDSDNIRRGKKTVHSAWGIETAIIAGDFLYGKTIEIVTRANYPKILELIAQTTTEMCLGEILEMDLHNNHKAISEEVCLQIIQRKTASLMKAAAESGALIGRGSEQTVKSIAKFGELMGMAYQIRDDVLNCISTETILKKPVKTDMLAMKPNLILFHQNKQKKRNAVLVVQEKAEQFSKMAKMEIEPLKLEKKPKKAMLALADFACQREY